MSLVQQRVQVGGGLHGVLGTVGRITPTSPGPVIYADPAVLGDLARDPRHGRGDFAVAGLQDDGGGAGAGAVEVEPVPAHVDQLTGHGVGGRVDRLSYGLVAATDRRQGQPGQQPGRPATAGLGGASAGAPG